MADDDWEDEQEDESPPPEIDFCTLGMFIIGKLGTLFMTAPVDCVSSSTCRVAFTRCGLQYIAESLVVIFSISGQTKCVFEALPVSIPGIINGTIFFQLYFSKR